TSMPPAARSRAWTAPPTPACEDLPFRTSVGALADSGYKVAPPFGVRSAGRAGPEYFCLHEHGLGSTASADAAASFRAVLDRPARLDRGLPDAGAVDRLAG